MLESYRKLNSKEKLKRTLGISVLTIILIVWLFAFSDFSILIKLIFTFMLIVAGVYQTLRDYKKFKEDE
ncbi:hypothetical protein [Planomicrobium okeanokoites]|uniref:Uncharacterized protein n=1 Tax=Planomicrobium okeanokoites TaxID=244 RepID=A0ABV7KMM9_PLAOK|nr:hypothetical protein [Planomicrobium okeanokoites]TAA65737.1 hypothetical protein D2910_16250 [Planomicrobium okeanokoites]